MIFYVLFWTEISSTVQLTENVSPSVDGKRRIKVHPVQSHSISSRISNIFRVAFTESQSHENWFYFVANENVAWNENFRRITAADGKMGRIDGNRWVEHMTKLYNINYASKFELLLQLIFSSWKTTMWQWRQCCTFNDMAFACWNHYAGNMSLLIQPHPLASMASPKTFLPVCISLFRSSHTAGCLIQPT